MTTVIKLVRVFSLFVALTLLSLCGCSEQGAQSDSSASSNQVQSSVAVTGAQALDGHIDISVQIDAASARENGVDTSAIDIIPGPATYQLTMDANAYDALVATGADLDGTPSYVTSINGVAEGAAGKSSGWMYEVNGAAPTVAANECVLQNGDSVRWYFSSWE